MNPTPPMICGTLLATMMGAGLSHFWSVQEMVERFPTTPSTRLVPISPDVETPGLPATTPASHDLAKASLGGDAQREFFEGLLAEVKALRNENRNLVDQVAETNRDMMKMEFRLDTHSESFRPLPTSEDRSRGDLSSTPGDDLPGVLPPRASPVFPMGE